MVDGNPCIEYLRLVVFPWFGRLQVSRSDKNGGDRCAAFVSDRRVFFAV